MEISVIARQALLYGHIIAFALALATILKEDVRLVRAQRIDSASLRWSRLSEQIFRVDKWGLCQG